ncbi:hypothetical protein J6590_017890 [Homalodisca vitripennis]|nr:hypothetical protein J6590_017890 [Homalodisca vitripennis]
MMGSPMLSFPTIKARGRGSSGSWSAEELGIIITVSTQQAQHTSSTITGLAASDAGRSASHYHYIIAAKKPGWSRYSWIRSCVA